VDGGVGIRRYLMPEPRVNKVTGEFAVVAARIAAVQLAAFLLIPILTKSLGADAYGVWAQYKSGLRMLTPIISLNLAYGLIRQIPSTPREARVGQLLSTMAVVLLGSSVGALATYSTRDWLANTFLEGQVEVVVLFAFMLPVFATTSLLLDFLRAERSIVTHSLFSVGLNLAVPVGFLALMASGESLHACLTYYLVIQAVVLSWLAVHILRTHPVSRPTLDGLPALILFSLPLVAVALQFAVVEFADRFFVAYYLGLEATGSYTTGYQIASGLQVFVTPFTFLLPAIIAKKWDLGQRAAVGRVLTDSAAVFVGVSVPVILVFGAYGRPLLRLLSNAAIADRAGTVLLVISGSYLLYGVFVIAALILYATKRSASYAALWIASVVANLALNVLLIPRFGIDGAAVATFAAHFLLLLCFITVFGRKGEGALGREVWLLLLAAAPLAVATALGASRVGAEGYRAALLLGSIVLWAGYFRWTCPRTLERLLGLLGLDR
jgi:O-antigen/teichoic acid export membrane protein